LAKKLIKIAQNCVGFLYIFRIYSLKIFAVGGLGGGDGPRSPPPVYAPVWRIKLCVIIQCFKARSALLGL